MPLISYVQLIRLRETDDYEELRRSALVMVEKEPDQGTHGPRIIVPAHKEGKWRKRGYRPVDEGAGEAERVLRERAFEQVRQIAGIPHTVPEEPQDEVSRLQGLTVHALRDMVREAGYNITAAMHKNDLIALLLDATKPQEILAE